MTDIEKFENYFAAEDFQIAFHLHNGNLEDFKHNLPEDKKSYNLQTFLVVIYQELTCLVLI
jgi:hypothetical protein